LFPYTNALTGLVANVARQCVVYIASIFTSSPFLYARTRCPSARRSRHEFCGRTPPSRDNQQHLELADGTVFIGHREMGSKLFIRSFLLQGFFEDNNRRRFNGSMDNIVVTGTPGIGKSVFGYYLLYLLRLEGKTVVFELKEKWYRFSDEGVVQRAFRNF